MAKSKYAPALFEVIDRPKDAKASGRLAVPKWWKSGPAGRPPGKPETPPEQPMPAASDSSEAPAVLEPPVAPEPAPPSALEGPEAAPPSAMEAAEPVQVSAAEPAAEAPQESLPPAPPAPAAEQADELVERAPILRVHSGRIELSLNPVGVVVVVGGLLLALMLSYQLGRNFGAPKSSARQAGVNNAAVREVGDVSTEPRDASVLGDKAPKSPEEQPGPAGKSAPKADITIPRPDKTPAAPPAVAGQRTAGLHYVVLQIFADEHKPAADFARAWLATRGIHATLERHGNNHWKLLSLQDFGLGNPAGAPEYLQYRSKVQSLGKELAGELAKAGLPVYNLNEPYPQRLGN